MRVEGGDGVGTAEQPHGQLGEPLLHPRALVGVVVVVDHVVELVGGHGEHVVAGGVAAVGGQVDHVGLVAGEGLSAVGELVVDPEEAVGGDVEAVVEEEDPVEPVEGVGRVAEVGGVELPDPLVGVAADALVLEVGDDPVDVRLVDGHVPLVVVDHDVAVGPDPPHRARLEGGHRVAAQVPDVPEPGVAELRVRGRRPQRRAASVPLTRRLEP